MARLGLDSGGSSRQDPALLLVGTDHRSSPLELRERVSYKEEDAEELLVHLIARPEIAEACLVSTCNRTEVYVQPRADEQAYRTALDLVFLKRAAEMEQPGRLFVLRDGAAARHLLAVASGLESMVLGEPEIMGQVKQAAALADALGTSGTVLRRLLRASLAAGKRARAESAISSGAVSLGYAVVELARNIFTRLEECHVLLLGAGETARLVATSLIERGTGRLTVANRTAARAERFAAEFPSVQVIPFEARTEALGSADVVVASTGAEEPLVHGPEVDQAMARRPNRPLLLVDLGVPRNIEAAAGRIENVFLHAIDSLDHLIQRNLKRRREEVPKVEEIIEQELGYFRAWYRGLEAEPLIARLQKQAERIRRDELAGALARFPPETHEDLERLTRSLIKKILHHPSARLRGKGAEESLPRLDLVRELFHLDDDEPEEP